MIEFVRSWIATHAPNALRVALILVLAWIIARILRSVIRRIERIADDGDPATTTELEKRAQTVSRILRQASAVLVWSVTIMLVLGEL
ncbi:MAG TPA: hypothetical protein VFB67_09780, partial [Candidatus Polarisedimenticolaceae bacterium]|nr:hypothetical protein [Candidatus Polarisedimenticolaceae bacterium]